MGRGAAQSARKLGVPVRLSGTALAGRTATARNVFDRAVAASNTTALPAENRLVAQHLPLVRKMAAQLACQIPPTLEFEDVVQAGAIGLVEAIRGFDPARGVAFSTFAGIRIRGAMIDEIRRDSWAPRSVYRKARLIDRARRDVENSTGRRASSREIADMLGLSADELGELVESARFTPVVRVDLAFDDQVGDEDSGPLEILESEWFAESLERAVERLSERERAVMWMYYVEDLKLGEIGARLGLTESRICQLHKQAVARVRRMLRS